MLADRFSLRRKLQQTRASLEQGKPVDRLIAEISNKLRESVARLEARKLALPKPEYPNQLPVSGRKYDIAAAIAKHQVVIVCGETGSGKTTQLPKICVEVGRGDSGLIGHP